MVTFVSPPLGISLQFGEGERNARLVKMERYDNNDNGVKVPLNSAKGKPEPYGDESVLFARYHYLQVGVRAACEV